MYLYDTYHTESKSNYLIAHLLYGYFQKSASFMSIVKKSHVSFFRYCKKLKFF
ncbi:hypothetical protein HanHA300_Chr15g0581291 [Helianthus annuus]|nr:hypothetical protein HanHA300_Chr15g0581291 [Helianthus annuus]KAJ0474557.1 hypothetical protein HanHA89_Chr15g0631041 [Helianthus annuus]KAJ0650114.1 hypothetical protein HanLR1_Chr15g0591961 [Helianthus annuus]KAJ0653886.1 hypothetical protein HanOQP8_Chr15g0588621 [Helianthus annuus]